MKKVLTSLLLLVLGLSAYAEQLAFPGADGYGKYTTGGRGGEVCYVTRLDDCTDANLVEGTLRWALRHDNGGKPRTILFKVGGTILLTSDLKFQYPDVSILGQTAPGGGICIAGYKFYICKNNVILRYLRFRAGDLAGRKKGKSAPSIDMENIKHAIIDHCSITWSMEECLTAYDNDSTTVQWCIIGEALYNSMNAKGARSYATQWGGQWSTMHHCLLTNSNNRVPRFNGVRSNATWYESTQKYTHDKFVDSEFANNVLFNWGKSNSAYGGEDDLTVNNDGEEGAHNAYDHIYMINNYWRPGPNTQKNVGSTRYFVQDSKSNADGYGQWYLAGNKFELGSKFVQNKDCWKDAALELVNADNLWGYVEGKSNRAFNLDGATANQTNYDKYVLAALPEGGLSGLSYETADEAYASVCQAAGCSLPYYDEVDRRLLDEAAGIIDPVFFGPSTAGGSTPSRGIGIIDCPNDITFTGPTEQITIEGVDTCNVYPDLRASAQEIADLIDTDGDGITDMYEAAHGLNPNDAADGAALAENGYTHLENFLNGVADGSITRSDYTGLQAIQRSGVSATARYYNLFGQPAENAERGIIIDATSGKRIIFADFVR